jgi:hypothetical protein
MTPCASLTFLDLGETTARQSWTAPVRRGAYLGIFWVYGTPRHLRPGTLRRAVELGAEPECTQSTPWTSSTEAYGPSEARERRRRSEPGGAGGRTARM